MRNFLDFLSKYQFTFLFLLLEVFAFYLLVNQNSFHQSRLHKASLATTGSIYQAEAQISGYFGLKEENQSLRNQNAELQELLYEAYYALENQSISTVDSSLGFRIITSKVISASYNRGLNHVIINAGRAQGVEPDCGVSSPSGVLGIVKSCSENYSYVMPIIHPKVSLSCRLAKNEYFGLLKWDGSDLSVAVLEDIPNHVEIQPQDSVITRGGAGYFPEGIAVGTVIASNKDKSSGFQTATVKLSTNFKSINAAYVFKNLNKSEWQNLIKAQADE